MANITVSFNNAVKDRVIDACSYLNGYQDNVTDPNDPENTIPNPQSKDDFVQELVARYLFNNVQAYEVQSDTTVAKQVAKTKVKNEVVIT